MKFLFKLFFGIGLMIALVIAAIVITLIYINPNDYKGSIAEKLKEETGRDIRIDGDINLSYYPWLGLDVEGITVSNAKGFGDKPFLQTKTIKARVKLLPLLRKELEMDTLVLHGATVNLARNEKGVSNWDDLIKAEDTATKDNQPMPLAALVLGGIDIQEANIYWNDKQQGLEYKITDAKISTGELKYGEPITLSAVLNASASKPALSAAIQFNGTVAYEDSGDVLLLKPMLLEANVKGKEIPGGQALVKLSSEININLDEETASINSLDLTAFDTQLIGQIKSAKILSGKPEVSGEVAINGKDLAALLKIVEVEPLASQLAKMSDKKFDISTSFNADTNRNDIDISKLDISLLGNRINAEIYARNIGSETPAAKGKIKANGADLPALIKIASQFMGEASQDLKSLSSELASASKPFDVQTDFDVDLKSGVIDIPSLSIKALGMDASGKISGKQINSDTPAINGVLKASGDNLPLLISIMAQLKGASKKDTDALSKQLSSVSKSFAIDTRFDTDSKTNSVSIPALSINALGMTANGNLKARKINSDSPAISGELKAKGPNLPLLLQIATSLQEGDSQLANDLGKIEQKAFDIDTKFDADIGSGKINLPSLNVNAFGFKVNGNLKGDNIQKSNGSMNGKIVVSSENPKPLLTAMGQADVAQVLKSISVNTGINGNTSKLNLKPFSFEGVFSGKQIPNSPARLTIHADSEINLDKETFNLSGLQVKGLGLDVKGSINASKFKTAPAISGQIALAPFDLRQFMKSLNKEVPETADANVLKRFAVASSFSGTTSSLSLKDLKAELDETKLQGDINIKQISPLDIEFGLGVDKLNADRYLPPDTETKAVTPEAAAVGAATGLPVETLRAIKIKGDFVMGQLTISNAKLSDMELSIRADKGDIKLAPATAKLYKGSYAGDIHLDATGKLPKLTMNTKLRGVEAEPLLTDVVGSANAKGTANITLDVSSSGADINTLRNTLSGKGDILFEKGTLIGVDVKSVLHQVEIMIENKNFGTPDAGEKTEFDKLTATLNIHNGIIDNNDMLMLGSGYSVTGKGMLLNLNDETWKYVLIAKADPTRVKQGEKTYNIGGHEVPIKCKGKIADKNCKPDIEAIAATIVKKAVVDKLFEEIGVKKKSSGTTTEPGGEQEVVPQEPVQDIKQKVIKDVFDKIF
ncbi:MAG: AsmA family protein [Proteobacteria bacterium]|nr:AsmA family protein [Pseudomonadota bacterium]NOG60428.1 AsmA family protein [Pseudomonadota bacterium]